MAGKPTQELRRAAKAIYDAKALIVTSGAGMGVDSGLPDFRGPEGFWRAYPPLAKRGLVLHNMSTPHWFETDPEFAWGFFGHRYNLYKNTEPHKGFQILRQWADKMDHGHFVFTSNVDGHFQKAGYQDDKVVECHGSINFMQCIDRFNTIWPVPEETIYSVDDKTLNLTSSLPYGPPGKDKILARPNILMFNDWGWIGDRTDAQQSRFNTYLKCLRRQDLPFVVIEIGAGLAVPTVRHTSEQVSAINKQGVLVRINPNEPEVPESKHISLPMRGLEALEEIEKLMENI